MEEKKLHIGQGKASAFLICDNSLKTMDPPFIKWLRDEGFTFGGYHGNYGCPWIHVNITRKQYAYGMPGVALAVPLGNHAITMDEFMTIGGFFVVSFIYWVTSTSLFQTSHSLCSSERLLLL